MSDYSSDFESYTSDFESYHASDEEISGETELQKALRKENELVLQKIKAQQIVQSAQEAQISNEKKPQEVTQFRGVDLSNIVMHQNDRQDEKVLKRFKAPYKLVTVRDSIHSRAFAPVVKDLSPYVTLSVTLAPSFELLPTARKSSKPQQQTQTPYPTIEEETQIELIALDESWTQHPGLWNIVSKTENGGHKLRDSRTSLSKQQKQKQDLHNFIREAGKMILELLEEEAALESDDTQLVDTGFSSKVFSMNKHQNILKGRNPGEVIFLPSDNREVITSWGPSPTHNNHILYSSKINDIDKRFRLMQTEAEVKSLAFTADQNLLFAGMSDGTIASFDLAAKHTLLFMRQRASVSSPVEWGRFNKPEETDDRIPLFAASKTTASNHANPHLDSIVSIGCASGSSSIVSIDMMGTWAVWSPALALLTYSTMAKQTIFQTMGIPTSLLLLSPSSYLISLSSGSILPIDRYLSRPLKRFSKRYISSYHLVDHFVPTLSTPSLSDSKPSLNLVDLYPYSTNDAPRCIISIANGWFAVGYESGTLAVYRVDLTIPTWTMDGDRPIIDLTCVGSAVFALDSGGCVTVWDFGSSSNECSYFYRWTGSAKPIKMNSQDRHLGIIFGNGDVEIHVIDDTVGMAEQNDMVMNLNPHSM